MAFEPKIEGVKQSSLFEYEDECGKCYIAGVGGMPEREHTFYYADSRYEFCFYATANFDGSEFDVDVKDATIYRFHGPSPRINPDDFDRIGRNMAKFFAERWFVAPSEPIPSTEKFRSLKFSWVLASMPSRSEDAAEQAPLTRPKLKTLGLPGQEATAEQRLALAWEQKRKAEARRAASHNWTDDEVVQYI